MPAPGHFTVVSDRLPNSHITETSDGHAYLPDTLARAVASRVRTEGGTWFGWPGGGQRLESASGSAQGCCRLEPVELSATEAGASFSGFAHSVLWPLFHGFTDHCDFRAGFWEAYLAVNRKFALRIMRTRHTGGQLWVHGYPLIHVGRMLRAANADFERIGFSLHIPFPSADIFERLPWKNQILSALLDYDLIGFQTHQDRRNFMASVQASPLVADRVSAVDGHTIMLEHRRVHTGVFPVGSDYEDLSRRSTSAAVSQRIAALRDDVGPYDVLLGVDRLDYTKGLLHRLHAFEHALERHASLRERVVLYQLIKPSRETVAAYRQLKTEIERTVGRILGRFSTTSWKPIIYRYTDMEATELSALYRMADVALVTPLRDGMNLVAKDFVASQVDLSGALVLSEFAGAAQQLGDNALLVNPYDVRGSADAIERALRMPRAQRRARMSAMRETVAATDVRWWASRFRDALARIAQEAHPVDPGPWPDKEHSLPLGAG